MVMNKSILYGLLCLGLVFAASSQAVTPRIVQAEVFIDQDPGEGGGMVIPLPEDGHFDQSLEHIKRSVSIGALGEGLHTLYWRVKDHHGSWSLPSASPFYVPDQQTGGVGAGHHNALTEAEMFVDEDPGYGNGTAVSISLDGGFDESFERLRQGLALNTLENGLHSINLRFRDTNGNWSPVITQPFLLTAQGAGGANTGTRFGIIAAEAFLDQDPGEGNGALLYLAADGSPTASLEEIRSQFDIAGLEAGIYTLHVRFQDASGRWSFPTARSLHLLPGHQTHTGSGTGVSPIVAAEYQLDGGAAQPAAAEDGQFGGLTETVNQTVSVSAGYHSQSITFLDAAGRRSASSVPDDLNPRDTDWDGLPNDWEIANGTNPNLADGWLDPDGDGYNNLQEYEKGSQATIVLDDDLRAFITFLNQDSLLEKMSLLSHLSENLARSDAVSLVERMLHLTNPAFVTDVSMLLNPFADVPLSSDYYGSLMTLAYFRSSSFDITPIDRGNTHFNPLRHMTREEFLAIVMTGFDVPAQDASLAAFSDTGNMSGWAVKYFRTAVHHGIIRGNSGQLLARDKISLYEALLILKRIKENFDGAYGHEPENFETNDDLSETYLKGLLHHDIGYQYTSDHHVAEATPIEITGIDTTSFDGQCMPLRVNATVDISKGAQPFFWWKSNYGYFSTYQQDENYQQVCFYPQLANPQDSYKVIVSGSDNLGYTDRYEMVFTSEQLGFTYDTQASVNSDSLESHFIAEWPSHLVANRVHSIGLNESFVRKTELDLGLEKVVVSLSFDDVNGQSIEHFVSSGKATQGRFSIKVPDFPDLYGKQIALSLQIQTGSQKQSFVHHLDYVPQFTVNGSVVNSGASPMVSSITVDGVEVDLDDDGRFSVALDYLSEVTGLVLSVNGSHLRNSFESVLFDLDFGNPTRYFSLEGVDRSIIDTDGDGVPDDLDNCSGQRNLAQTNSDDDELGDRCDPDDDNDGLPDVWEIDNRLNQLDPSDAEVDTDGDGYSNAEEFARGTNPNDPNDSPAASGVLNAIIPMLLND